MAKPYVRRIFSRAWDMTKSDIGIEGKRPSIRKVLLLLVGLAIMWAFGLTKELANQFGSLQVTGLAFVFVLGAIFVSNLIVAAPSRLLGEADDEIEALKLKLENKANRQAAIDKLWELRSEGISLRNARLADETEVQPWRDQIDEWRGRVLVEAGNVNVNLRHYLERLDTTGLSPANSAIVNSAHDQYVRIASEILKRLIEYLKREMET